ncbi:MAG: helix-turn-helix domain-containing protein [Chloracidobacterium sp.]|nr:helix-turn-helix domain-containing protein [Chloracidobacterium sp.]
MPELLTISDVAGLLRVSRATAYGLRDRIGWVRVGVRSVRFESEAVQAYIERQRCHAPEAGSSSAPAPRSGRPSGPTTPAASTSSPRVAETMELLRRGSPRARWRESEPTPGSR